MQHTSSVKELTCIEGLEQGLKQLFDTQQPSFSGEEQFQRKSGLKIAHKTDLVRNERWNCSGCERVFGSKAGMYQHMKRHHLDFKCEFCPDVFHVRVRLDSHIERDHFGIIFPRLPCELCERTYADIGGLANHLKQKHHEAPLAFLRRVMEKYPTKHCIGPEQPEKIESANYIQECLL